MARIISETNSRFRLIRLKRSWSSRRRPEPGRFAADSANRSRSSRSSRPGRFPAQTVEQAAGASRVEMGGISSRSRIGRRPVRSATRPQKPARADEQGFLSPSSERGGLDLAEMVTTSRRGAAGEGAARRGVAGAARRGCARDRTRRRFEREAGAGEGPLGRRLEPLGKRRHVPRAPAPTRRHARIRVSSAPSTLRRAGRLGEQIVRARSQLVAGRVGGMAGVSARAAIEKSAAPTPRR